MNNLHPTFGLILNNFKKANKEVNYVFSESDTDPNPGHNGSNPMELTAPEEAEW